jgi:MSHA pilin protein MshA
MQKKKNLLQNEKGFTLIEIIAVLVILGILAAVAVPKYIDLTTTAKVKASEGQVAEMKATLNLAYANYYITNSAAPSGVQAIVAAGFVDDTAKTVGVTPDVWTVKLKATGNKVDITISQRGTDTGYAATGVWNVPS